MVDPENTVSSDHDTIDFADHHDDVYSHVDDDGMLRIVEWATAVKTDETDNRDGQLLHVPDERGDYDMAHSTAHGDALVSTGELGVDLIRIDEGDGFVPHTHPGDHILIPVYGTGTITYDGHVYPTDAGAVYIINGDVPHGVGAITDHGILAVGSPHAPIDSPDRMTPTEYDEVTAELDSVHCLICDLDARNDEKLHQIGCEHCPCHDCLGVDGENNAAQTDTTDRATQTHD